MSLDDRLLHGDADPLHVLAFRVSCRRTDRNPCKDGKDNSKEGHHGQGRRGKSKKEIFLSVFLYYLIACITGRSKELTSRSGEIVNRCTQEGLQTYIL